LYFATYRKSLLSANAISCSLDIKSFYVTERSYPNKKPLI